MPLTVTVSVVPAASPSLEPVTIRFCPCSMLLITSSPATVSMRRPGRLASIVISRSPAPVLPWPLVTDADTVRSPLPSAVRTDSGTFTDQVRSLCTVAV